MKRSTKWLSGIFVMIILLLACARHLLLPHPPSDSELVQNFQTHRQSFEKIRDMLQADTHLRRVAPWGVELQSPFFLGKPSENQFPNDRYQQYLGLLKDVNGLLASRSEHSPADPNIVMWAYGFGGDVTHIGICWLDSPPTNQVDSLTRDKIFGTGTVTYRHIDQNWYLWAD